MYEQLQTVINTIPKHDIKLIIGDLFLLAVIYPDPQGGYNPQFSCDTPAQPSEVQRGLSGGCLRGCLCDRDGRGNKRGQILT